MNFQERLNSLRPYAVGLRFNKDLPVVDVMVNQEWIFLNRENIIVKESEKTKNYFMFYTNEPSVSIDDILNFVEECVNYNKEIELKKILYKEYTGQLKKIFDDSPYEKLKTLEFNFSKIKDNSEHIDLITNK